MNYHRIPAPLDIQKGYGWGQSIVADKCDSNWTDRECPNPATCAEYHYGSFGHKVLFIFCPECYQKTLDRRANQLHGLFKDEARYRGFESYQEKQ